MAILKEAAPSPIVSEWDGGWGGVWILSEGGGRAPGLAGSFRMRIHLSVVRWCHPTSHDKEAAHNRPDTKKLSF